MPVYTEVMVLEGMAAFSVTNNLPRDGNSFEMQSVGQVKQTGHSISGRKCVAHSKTSYVK